MSRTHLILKVAAIASGDSTLIHKAEIIEVEDRSKTGSTINGEKINKQSKALEPGDYTIKLGHYQPAFHLRWKSVVLSVTNLSKGAKKSSDALAVQRAKMEQAGVKLTTSYLPNSTTHVVAKKRNTAMGLQALIQAKWVVTDAFIDALFSACKREAGTGADGQPYQSPLESDFDGNWPAENEYIVPVGDEPAKRPDEALLPKLERSTIFQELTFVFLSQAQYDQLMPVITVGGGKASIFQYRPDETSVQDVVAFVADLAGVKIRGRFQLSQQGYSNTIVVVRIADNASGRSASFMRELDIALDQRSMEQSEFFGAIVDIDTSSLQQSLRDESESVGGSQMEASRRSDQQHLASTNRSALANEAHEDQSQMERGHSEQPSAAVPKRSRRLVTQSRFKGFDDFDPSQIVRDDSDSPEPSEPQSKNDVQMVDDGADMAIDEESSMHGGLGKKRRHPDDAAYDEDRAMLDELLPGAAALKRRRTEALKNGEKDIFARTVKDTAVASSEDPAKSKPKKSFLDKDIKAEIRKRRQKEEEERRKDEEALQTALDVDISELKNLAKVETFALPVRTSRPTEASGGTAPGWNPAWNGRKNFKKFRPRGQRNSENAGLELPKVVVRLEPVQDKDTRSNEDYFLLPNASLRSKSRSQSQSQRPTEQPHTAASSGTTAVVPDSVPVDSGADDDDALSFRRRTRRVRDAESSGPASGNPVIEPRQAAVSNQNSATVDTQQRKTAAGKRPAAQQPRGGPAAKKSRLASSRIATEVSDDEDPLAFKRKRR